MDNRLFVGAVPWTARSGAPWRDLPEKFGPWNGVYQRFARWRNCGVWQRLFCVLAGDADFEEALIDTITASGSEAVIRRANQTESRTFDRHIYQGRNLADRFPSYQALSQNSNALR